MRHKRRKTFGGFLREIHQITWIDNKYDGFSTDITDSPVVWEHVTGERFEEAKGDVFMLYNDDFILKIDEFVLTKRCICFKSNRLR